MQPRLVSKFAFIAWNAFTSNFISASEVENIWLFLSLQRCGATTETQDLSGAVLSTLSPWQTGRFEHGTWMVGHQGELKQRLASRVWPCGEIVSLFWLPGVLPSIQTVPHALAAAPAGPASPEVIFLQVLVPPVRDLGSPPSLAQPWDLQPWSCPGRGALSAFTDCHYFPSLLNIHTLFKFTGSNQK